MCFTSHVENIMKYLYIAQGRTAVTTPRSAAIGWSWTLGTGNKMLSGELTCILNLYNVYAGAVTSVCERRVISIFYYSTLTFRFGSPLQII